jgi:hypothetical protein
MLEMLLWFEYLMTMQAIELVDAVRVLCSFMA